MVFKFSIAYWHNRGLIIRIILENANLHIDAKFYFTLAITKVYKIASFFIFNPTISVLCHGIVNSDILFCVFKYLTNEEYELLVLPCHVNEHFIICKACVKYPLPF